MKALIIVPNSILKTQKSKEITRKISYVKRSSKQSSSSPVVRFLKEWGSWYYCWSHYRLSHLPLGSGQGGRPFDGSNLADSEYLLVVNHLSIDRFDIVVANEKDDDGKPGLSSSGSSVFLEILSSTTTIPSTSMGKDQRALFERLHRSFQKDKLQSTYTGKRLRRKRRTLPANWPIQPKLLQ